MNGISLADEDFAKASFGGNIIFSGKVCTIKKYSVKTIDEAKRTGRKEGDYYSLSYEKEIFGNEKKLNVIVKKLSELLCDTADMRAPLVVGLGNQKITSDSLGCETIEKLSKEKRKPLLFKPNVYGQCGIESADSVKGIVDITHPSAVITIDSLGCIGVEKLYSSFQLTTAGITPGEAIGNDRKRIDEKTLGVPVISLGAPLICYPDPTDPVCVTPKEIDLIVDVCAEVLARATIRAFNDKRSCLK